MRAFDPMKKILIRIIDGYHIGRTFIVDHDSLEQGVTLHTDDQGEFAYTYTGIAKREFYFKWVGNMKENGRRT